MLYADWGYAIAPPPTGKPERYTQILKETFRCKNCLGNFSIL